MTKETHLMCESIQEITLYAWPIIWADNKYDQDSRNVLETLRGWGEEFENWWMSQTEDWQDDHDYLEEIWAFAHRKCEEYLESLKTQYAIAVTMPITVRVDVRALNDEQALEMARMQAPIAELDKWTADITHLTADIIRKI